MIIDQSHVEKEIISNNNSNQTIVKIQNSWNSKISEQVNNTRNIENSKISGKGNEINIISSLNEEMESVIVKSQTSREYDFESNHDPLEESKHEGELEFSVHEHERVMKTKETINETAEDEIIDLEMIQIATNSQKSDKSIKLFKEGIKLIKKSLRKTERTMGDLLDLLLGSGVETERRERSRVRDKKNKRSNSLFGWFGSKSRKKLVKEEGNQALQLKKINSVTVEKDKENISIKKNKKKDKERKHKKDKKEKRIRKIKKQENKNKEKLKSEEEKWNTVEIMKKSDRIPIIKSLHKLEGSQVINLNSSFK